MTKNQPVKTVELHGHTVDFDAAVQLMDDDIREELHSALAPCTDQEFMDAYAAEHEERFGEEFVVN